MTTIISLHQGIYNVGSDKQFVKYAPDEDVVQHGIRKTGLALSIQPFVLQTMTSTILLDAGIHEFLPERGQETITHNLAMHGLKPKNIDIVLISHLHYDHFSGLFRYQETPALNIPYAEYYLYKHDVDDFFSNKRYPHFENKLRYLLEHANVHLLDSEKGTINEEITYQATQGHANHHVSFWIKSNQGTIFYGGDEAPQLAQMRINYVAKYDHDGRQAMQWRKKWFEQGKQEGWTFLFYHDIKHPIYKATLANS